MESKIQFSSTGAFAADFAGGFDFQFDVQPATPTRYGVKFLEGMEAAGLGLRFAANAADRVSTYSNDLFSIISVTRHGLAGRHPSRRIGIQFSRRLI